MSALVVRQLTWAQVAGVRDELAGEQGGACPICRRPLDRAVLDHSHTRRIKGSGLVRGVLCNSCNRYLGVIENNRARCGLAGDDAPSLAAVLRNVAAYIEAPQKLLVHPSERPKVPRLTLRCWNRLRKAAEKVGGPCPPYSGRLTRKLEKAFAKHGVTVEFFS
jgi:hypothetical protein